MARDFLTHVLRAAGRKADQLLDTLEEAFGDTRADLAAVLGLMFLGFLLLVTRGIYKLVTL